METNDEISSLGDVPIDCDPFEYLELPKPFFDDKQLQSKILDKLILRRVKNSINKWKILKTRNYNEKREKSETTKKKPKKKSLKIKNGKNEKSRRKHFKTSPEYDSDDDYPLSMIQAKLKRNNNIENSHPVCDQENDEVNPKNAQDEEYEVEEILDCRVIDHRKQFLLKWRYYPPWESTWEWEEYLKCPNLIENFLKKNSSENSAETYVSNGKNNVEPNPISDDTIIENDTNEMSKNGDDPTEKHLIAENNLNQETVPSYGPRISFNKDDVLIKKIQIWYEKIGAAAPSESELFSFKYDIDDPYIKIVKENPSSSPADNNDTDSESHKEQTAKMNEKSSPISVTSWFLKVKNTSNRHMDIVSPSVSDFEYVDTYQRCMDTISPSPSDFENDTSQCHVGTISCDEEKPLNSDPVSSLNVPRSQSMNGGISLSYSDERVILNGDMMSMSSSNSSSSPSVISGDMKTTSSSKINFDEEIILNGGMVTMSSPVSFLFDEH